MRTRVGYAGGATPDPTYHDLADHTETLQVDFDPTVISYRELLAVFWDSHAPVRPAWSRQYMSMVMTHDAADDDHDDDQQALAIASKRQREVDGGQTLHTCIVPAGPFYLAEDYHQKYRLRRDPILVAEFERMYPAVDDLVASTAAARVNGYVGGHGDPTTLERDRNLLGLSAAGVEALKKWVGSR